MLSVLCTGRKFFQLDYTTKPASSAYDLNLSVWTSESFLQDMVNFVEAIERVFITNLIKFFFYLKIQASLQEICIFQAQKHQSCFPFVQFKSGLINMGSDVRWESKIQFCRPYT